MSGAAFEGLEQALAGRHDAAEDYTPADRGYAPELLTEMMQWYENEEILYAGWPRRVSSFSAAIRTRMTPAFSPQRLLDDVAYAVAQADQNPYHVGRFFDTLVQALYELGGNSFAIDLAQLRQSYFWTFGSNLRGTRERPLRATYLGAPVHYFGGGSSEHCILTLSGDAAVVGEGASQAEFTIMGTSDLESLGKTATGCTFRIADLHAGSYPVQEGWPYCSNLYCTKLLAEQRNSLFHKDASGAWVEVPAEVRR